MTTENTSSTGTPTAEDLEISSAFAEFTADPDTAPAAKTPEEIAAETAAAAAPAAKTPEEIAAEAAAVAAPAAKTPEEIVAETAAAETAAAETTAAETAAAETAAAETAAAETAARALSAKAVEDPRIAEMQAQIDALKPKAAAEQPQEIYTPEEKIALAKYTEDWPDIAQAEALTRRAEYRELVSYVFQQMNAKFAPALEYAQNRGAHDQYSDIKALVPDYDTVRDKTLAWVDTQPTWLKDAYSKVANEGTPEEVAGLIALYRKEIGAPAQIAPVAIAAPAAVAPAITPAAKAVAAKLSIVKSGKSDAGTAAEDTFETAFAAYAADEDKRLSRK